METIDTTRVVILGAGLAALQAALALAPRPVLVVSPGPPGQGASSGWAQGGVAAAMAEEDSPEAHARDTIRAGAGLTDAGVAQAVAEAAPGRILALSALGAPFDRDAEGRYLLSREAAHGMARVVRVKGDQAGAGIMRALVGRLRDCASVQVLEGVAGRALEVTGGQVTGVRLAEAGTASATVLLRCPAVLLAAGGAGGLFAQTTNPSRIRGEAVGLAARAGAVVSDPEFVQFHPTALDIGEDPLPLATEALRGEGARLVNSRGERFMRALHPEAELAPRDVVARGVFAQARAGLRPMLNLRGTLGARLARDFPAVTAAAVRNGYDPEAEPLPVTAAAHFHMGGVETDAEGRSSLPGLWVCGEAAATGLHGANRLASNGLLEALVYACRCAESIGASLGEASGPAPVVEPEFRSPGAASPADAIAELRRTMSAGAGVIRTGEGLRATLRRISELEAAAPPGDAAFRNMTATATLIAAAALQRRESRGAHWRDDFPRAAGGPGVHTRITLAEALALRHTLEKETA